MVDVSRRTVTERPLRVLMLDDGSRAVERICAALNAQPDITVVCRVEDPGSLPERAAEHRADVILADLHAPGNNGVRAKLPPDLLARMRALLADPPVTSLSERERDVLVLVGEGAANAQIGRALDISESTVKGHVTRLLDKLGVDNRVQAALVAQRLREPGQAALRPGPAGWS